MNKIPSQRENLIKFIEGPSHMEKEDDVPIMLQSMIERKDGDNPHFLITLHVSYLILHNCIFHIFHENMMVFVIWRKRYWMELGKATLILDGWYVPYQMSLKSP